MGVLDGIRVLELARVPPAEMPGMFLADMGAEVLKIETPSEEPESAEARRRAAFAYVNRNKRSLALNMKDPKGGPYKDLVLAAERCPVRIIHPGTPLDPNEKDLAKWLERGKKFR